MTTEQERVRQHKSDRKFNIGMGMITVGGILGLMPALMIAMEKHPASLVLMLGAAGLLLLISGAIICTSDA